MVLEAREESAKKVQKQNHDEVAILSDGDLDLLDMQAPPLLFPPASSSLPSASSVSGFFPPSPISSAPAPPSSPFFLPPPPPSSTGEIHKVVAICLKDVIKDQNGEFSKKIMVKISDEVETLVTTTMQTAVDLLDGKINAIDDSVKAVGTRVDNIDTTMVQVLNELSALRLAHSSSPPAASSSPPPGAWGPPPGPNVPGSFNGCFPPQPAPIHIPSHMGGGLSADGSGIAFGNSNSHCFFAFLTPRFCSATPSPVLKCQEWSFTSLLWSVLLPVTLALIRSRSLVMPWMTILKFSG